MKEQLQLHPSMQPQDMVKLCFQAAYGAEHLLGDITRVRQYFDDEMARISERDGPLVEFIADDVCRVNMAVWKKHRLPGEWLFNLFVESAQERRGNGKEIFDAYMKQAEAFMPMGKEWQGITAPVHHTDIYRENEYPAYRVIAGRYPRVIPILACMTPSCVVAIDGRAASGKTTIAHDLAAVTGAGVIHVDDFFLPKALRTNERLASPGGNFHHERLAEEVLPFLRSGEGFSYRKFDCTSMTYDDNKRNVLPAPIRVVEGAYSCHPVLGSYMDLRVFSDIAPDAQMQRIEIRNGAMAAMYKEKWIPMEEAYLQAFSIKRNADVII